MLIAGLYVRAVAVALVPILIGAAWVHWPNGWLFSAPNGGWEYPVFLAAAAVVQALLGAGAFAMPVRRPAQRGSAAVSAAKA